MQERYLEHHGIRGQKWGVRRYQNPDGSLTPAGRKRYGEELDINDTSRTNVAKIRLGEARRRYDAAKKNNNKSELNSLRKKEKEASRAVRLAKRIDRGAKLATKGKTLTKNEAKATAEFLGIGYGTTILGNALTDAALNASDPKVFTALKIGANIVHGSRWPLIALSTINRSHIESGLRAYNEAIRSGRGTIKSIGGEEYRAVKKRKSMQHSYLEHHGVQGQKWGVRRFQNADGSLTPAGKIRYGYKTNSISSFIDSDVKKNGKIKYSYNKDGSLKVNNFDDTKYTRAQRYDANKFAKSVSKTEDPAEAYIRYLLTNDNNRSNATTLNFRRSDAIQPERTDGKTYSQFATEYAKNNGLSTFSDEEIRNINNRIRTEREFSNLTKKGSLIDKGLNAAMKINKGLSTVNSIRANYTKLFG